MSGWNLIHVIVIEGKILPSPLGSLDRTGHALNSLDLENSRSTTH